MKTVCFYNHKGGVGKTTVSAAVAGELVIIGKKVLLIDTDTQANLSSQLTDSTPEFELADYFFNQDLGVSSVLKKTKINNLFIITSKKLGNGGRLDDWKNEAADMKNRNKMRNLLMECAAFGFDYIIFDMPPSYTVLDQQILLSSDEVIPVLEIDKYSIDGLADFYKLLNELRAGDSKPALNCLVFNKFQKNKAVQKALLPAIENLELKKFIIPNDEVFRKAALQGKAVQSLNGMKAETIDVLQKIAKEIEGVE